MRVNLPPAISATLLALLGGCAAAPHPSAPQTPSPYEAYAGPPIDQFTWLGNFYSWQALGKDKLVVFTTPNAAYLLKVWSSCDLRWVVNTIGVTATSGTVNAHVDAIKIDSPPTGRMTCPIEEIRQIDYPRMRAEQRAPPPAQPQP
ncbi:MAG TPA: DUF6491 family protein [Steroidobacteraceae bacterium]|jgi:hypothetical protein|nr:DUF6491 family protein [Steroidobacteraceae bacterium]